MAKITGIGGVFFKSKNPASLKEWYNEVLGINTDEYGASFLWEEDQNSKRPGRTVWGVFKEDTDYFAPSQKDFMINFRVDNLKEFVTDLITKGVMPVGNIEEYSYGNFAWIIDPEGNKIEFWEPIGEKK